MLNNVPKCATISAEAPAFLTSKKCSNKTKWPELLIGKNSVTP
ncbi:uncharacterized protein METZ01_LOCUS15404 [marine metagenome]|uniref:Uncharacterized protein n=1 Tax=marine metagenome TaxID=408172 RepID=A0A381P6Q3_9ZZZZ